MLKPLARYIVITLLVVWLIGYYISLSNEDDFLNGKSSKYVENLVVDFGLKTNYSDDFKSIDFLSALKVDEDKSSEYLKELETTEYWERLIVQMASKNLVPSGFLVLAISNSGDYLLTRNFIKSLQLQGYDKFLIACLDVGLYVKLSSLSLLQNIALVPKSWLNEDISNRYVDWDSSTYNSLTKSKSLIVQRFLQLNFTVLLSDVDIVWLNPFVIDYLSILATTSDLVIMDGYKEFNSGFYLVKPTGQMLKMFNLTVQLQNNDPGFHDQLALNTAINLLSIDHKLIHKLDALLFANGYSFYHQKLNVKLHQTPWVFHANFLIGKKDKIKALKKSQFWFIPE